MKLQAVSDKLFKAKWLLDWSGQEQMSSPLDWSGQGRRALHSTGDEMYGGALDALDWKRKVQVTISRLHELERYSFMGRSPLSTGDRPEVRGSSPSPNCWRGA